MNPRLFFKHFTTALLLAFALSVTPSFSTSQPESGTKACEVALEKPSVFKRVVKSVLGVFKRPPEVRRPIAVRKIEQNFKPISKPEDRLVKFVAQWVRKVNKGEIEEDETYVSQVPNAPIDTPYFYGDPPLVSGRKNLLIESDIIPNLNPDSSYKYQAPTFNDFQLKDLTQGEISFHEREASFTEIKKALSPSGDVYLYAEGGFNFVYSLSSKKRPANWSELSEKAKDEWTEENGLYVIKYPKELEAGKDYTEVAQSYKVELGREELAEFLTQRATSHGKRFIYVKRIMQKFVFENGIAVMPFIKGPTLSEIYANYLKWLRGGPTVKRLTKKNFFDVHKLTPAQARYLLGNTLQFFKDTHDYVIAWELDNANKFMRTNAVFESETDEGPVEYWKAVALDLNHGDNLIWDADNQILWFHDR